MVVAPVIPTVVISTAPVLETAAVLPSLPVDIAVVPVVVLVPVPVLAAVGEASPVGASPVDCGAVWVPVVVLLSAGDGPHATRKRSCCQGIRIRGR